MKNNNKKTKRGFTLVELLAVIVILGVLLLIAVPSVTELITKSKNNAFVTTAKLYINAAKLQVASESDQRNRILINIENLEDEEIDTSKYSGIILAEKNITTGQYEYSINIIDNDTKQMIGNINNNAIVLEKNITTSDVIISHIEVDSNFYENTNLFEDSNGNRFQITPGGEVLENLLDSGTLLKFEKDDWPDFFVLNDSGDELTLLFRQGNSYTRNEDIILNSKSYNKTKEALEHFKNKFGEDITYNIRLLTEKDLMVYFNLNSLEELEITKSNELKEKLRKILFPTYNMGTMNNFNLIIDEASGNCGEHGSTPSESTDTEPIQCSGIRLWGNSRNSLNVAYSNAATRFNIRVVFSVAPDKRNNFYYYLNGTKTYVSNIENID